MHSDTGGRVDESQPLHVLHFEQNREASKVLCSMAFQTTKYLTRVE